MKNPSFFVLFISLWLVVLLSTSVLPYSPSKSESARLKGTAQGWFCSGFSFFQQGDYERARKEFRRLVKRYPHSSYAYKAEYYLGKLLEVAKKPYQAFQRYKRCVDNYQSGQEWEKALEGEYRVGEFFLAQKPARFLGLDLSVPLERAIEIFQEIRRQAPSTKWGVLAKYRLGFCYQGLNRWEEAIKEFEEFIKYYPTHPYVLSGDAHYQIAFSYFRSALSRGYDKQRLRDALEYLENFLHLYPQNKYAERAKKEIRQIKERLAEELFNIAEFYLSQGHRRSADLYYQEIIETYPKTSQAEKARLLLKKR